MKVCLAFLCSGTTQTTAIGPLVLKILQGHCGSLRHGSEMPEVNLSESKIQTLVRLMKDLSSGAEGLLAFLGGRP